MGSFKDKGDTYEHYDDDGQRMQSVMCGQCGTVSVVVNPLADHQCSDCGRWLNGGLRYKEPDV
ncbi:hypothetical protein SAMN05421505_16216 [Sinosporangium album]|uniref:Uncharacterized protein n=1 Tax=Sinosporangium album TaxID=504805 RepID=A0A1G8L6V5_9ACTN|nr:hypothetical protein [Sinosporangium album]SDI51413.1 hypothetical protein SAMN05421505_16216 [Sinosporangium album]